MIIFDGFTSVTRAYISYFSRGTTAPLLISYKSSYTFLKIRRMTIVGRMECKQLASLISHRVTMVTTGVQLTKYFHFRLYIL